MKKMSITARITLWYTLLMLVLVAFLAGFVGLISRSTMRQDTQERLRGAVDNSPLYIQYQNGVLQVDDKLETLHDGVFLSVYDAYGNLLHGRVPRTFNIDTPFSSLEMQRIDFSDNQFYYYDEQLNLAGYGSLWVRGVTFYSDKQQTLSRVVTLSLIILPLFVGAVLLGGYFITKRALRPVEDIRLSAEAINAGEDLNRRLQLTGRNDELYRLADTFDSMFDRLEQSFEREKQFSSDISHELRTPVSVILLEGQSLVESDLAPAQQDSAQRIVSQAERMSFLISQMLLLNRAEKGQVRLELEEIPLLELVTIIGEEEQPLLLQADIELRIAIPADSTVTADRSLLIRILMNLISNAIVYGRQGGWIEVAAKEEGDQLYLSVTDNGIGIAPQHLPNIWNRFYQVAPSRSQEEGSSAGLGLSIVRWAVQLHHWSIRVESKPEEGSRFTIIIPQQQINLPAP